MKEKWKLYLWLIRVNLFISAFTFGGGYVVVPMVKKYFVYGKGYFDEDELMEIAAIAQSTPGCHRGEPGLSGRLPGGRHCGACDQRRLCGDPASCDPVGDLRLLFCGDLQRPGGGGLKRHAGRSGRADRGFYRGHDRQGPEGEIPAFGRDGLCILWDQFFYRCECDLCAFRMLRGVHGKGLDKRGKGEIGWDN